MRRMQILHRSLPVQRPLYQPPDPRCRELRLLSAYEVGQGEDPACVSKCRYGALAFGDLNDPNSYVAKLLDVKNAVRVRTYLGTEPSLRYIPVMKEKI